MCRCVRVYVCVINSVSLSICWGGYHTHACSWRPLLTQRWILWWLYSPILDPQILSQMGHVYVIVVLLATVVVFLLCLISCLLAVLSPPVLSSWHIWCQVLRSAAKPSRTPGLILHLFSAVFIWSLKRFFQGCGCSSCFLCFMFWLPAMFLGLSRCLWSLTYALL